MALTKNHTLKKFEFSHSGFSDNDLLAIAEGLKCNTGLDFLNLRESCVTNNGIQSVLLGSVLRENRTLRTFLPPLYSVTRDTWQEVQHTLQRNKYLYDKAHVMDQPTGEDWFELLVLSSKLDNVSLSFDILRYDRPALYH